MFITDGPASKNLFKKLTKSSGEMAIPLVLTECSYVGVKESNKHKSGFGVLLYKHVPEVSGIKVKKAQTKLSP